MWWLDEGAAAPTNSSNQSFWEDLSNQLINAGQRFFMGQQTQDAELRRTQITTNAIVNVVKWVAIIYVAGKVLQSILKPRSR